MTADALGQLEAWFVCGSQHMYGAEQLRAVEAHAAEIAAALDAPPPRSRCASSASPSRRRRDRSAPYRSRPTRARRASASSPGCTRSPRRRCGSRGSLPSSGLSCTSRRSTTAIFPGPRSTWTSGRHARCRGDETTCWSQRRPLRSDGVRSKLVSKPSKLKAGSSETRVSPAAQGYQSGSDGTRTRERFPAD